MKTGLSLQILESLKDKNRIQETSLHSSIQHLEGMDQFLKNDKIPELSQLSYQRQLESPRTICEVRNFNHKVTPAKKKFSCADGFTLKFYKTTFKELIPTFYSLLQNMEE